MNARALPFKSPICRTSHLTQFYMQHMHLQRTVRCTWRKSEEIRTGMQFASDKAGSCCPAAAALAYCNNQLKTATSHWTEISASWAGNTLLRYDRKYLHGTRAPDLYAWGWPSLHCSDCSLLYGSKALCRLTASTIAVHHSRTRSLDEDTWLHQIHVSWPSPYRRP